MPLTAPDGAPRVPDGVLGSAEPIDVLYEAEEPVVFTLRTLQGQRLLAYVADATADARWVILVPCGDALLHGLQVGRVAVSDALTSSWAWLAQLDDEGRWLGAWVVEAAALPPEHLPRPGVMLLPEHAPVLATRATGDGIGRDGTPASVVAYLANATSAALKGVSELFLGRDGQGRPPDDLRAYYDLPVLRFAWRSFEIAYGPPTRPHDEAILRRSVETIQAALAWAASDDDQPFPSEDPEERRAVLRAIMQLTPPTRGGIDRIDVSGRWMGPRPAVLKRSARARVQAELRRTPTPQVVREDGYIRELDKDNLTFTLRGTREGPHGSDVKGVIEDGQLDDALDYFNTDAQVVLVGELRGGRLHVQSICPAPAQEATRPVEPPYTDDDIPF